MIFSLNVQFNVGVVKLENYDVSNELLNLVFNTNIVFYPSFGLVLLLYYIVEQYGIGIVLHAKSQ